MGKRNTHREEILTLLGRGVSPQEISKRLGVKGQTIGGVISAARLSGRLRGYNAPPIRFSPQAESVQVDGHLRYEHERLSEENRALRLLMVNLVRENEGLRRRGTKK